MRKSSWLKRLWRRLRKPPAQKPKARQTPDPVRRDDTGPFVADLLARLGNRFQLGEDRRYGARLQCRHAKYRFLDTDCYLDEEKRQVVAVYVVRVDEGHDEADALRLVDHLYGEELEAAEMTHLETRASGDTLDLAYASKTENTATLVGFIDRFSRGAETFLDLRHYAEEAEPEG